VRARLVVIACVVVAAVAAGAAGATAPARPVLWPAPPDPMARTVAAGLVPERHESFQHHVHAQLDVFVNGKHVRVPAGIGIDIGDPAVHVFPMPDGTKAYGGIRQCPKACISPLHTHDDTGMLHTESASPVPNTLGEFFIEWGVPLTRTCVGGFCHLTKPHVYLDGKPFSGDPRRIKLVDRLEIAIVIGKPPKAIPNKVSF
jgi:hypothetical protein